LLPFFAACSGVDAWRCRRCDDDAKEEDAALRERSSDAPPTAAAADGARDAKRRTLRHSADAIVEF
jgi:hypothetical protein